MVRFVTQRILLLATALVIGGSPAYAQPQPMAVSLTNYAYAPANLVLKAGTVYRLHLTNASNKAHDFSAPKFFADATVAPEDRAKVINGDVEVEARGSVDVTVTPSRSGNYPLICTHFMHSTLGMNGQITVQ